MDRRNGPGLAALSEVAEPWFLLVQPRLGDVDDVVGFLEAVLGRRFTLCVENDVFFAFRQLRRRGFDAVLLDTDLPRLERMAEEFAAAGGNHEVIVLDRRSGAARVEEVA